MLVGNRSWSITFGFLQGPELQCVSSGKKNLKNLKHRSKTKTKNQTKQTEKKPPNQRSLIYGKFKSGHPNASMDRSRSERGRGGKYHGRHHGKSSMQAQGLVVLPCPVLYSQNHTQRRGKAFVSSLHGGAMLSSLVKSENQDANPQMFIISFCFPASVLESSPHQRAPVWVCTVGKGVGGGRGVESCISGPGECLWPCLTATDS